MPKLIKKEIAYAKKQAAAGQAAVIAGGDALRAYDVGFSYEGLTPIDRPVMGREVGNARKRVWRLYGEDNFVVAGLRQRRRDFGGAFRAV